MSVQDAYNLALKETGKDRIPNDTAQNTEQNRPHGPEAVGASDMNDVGTFKVFTLGGNQ